MQFMKHIKAPWVAFWVVLAAVSFVSLPGQSWAQDDDMDGLDNQLEIDGFTLSPGFEFWGGGNMLMPGDLDPGIPDLFVIARLATPTNFDPARIEEYFSFAEAPVADGGLGFNVWVLREVAGSPPSDRQFSPAPQKAAVLIEDLDTDTGTKQGVAQYASIMTEGKGIARVFSQRVANQIEAACAQHTNTSVPCQDESGAAFRNDLIFRHLQWISIHEIMHLLFELDNSLRRVEGHHLTRGEYVLMPAVVFTDKRGKVTYHIPGEFSNTAVDNWKFFPSP